MKNMKNTFEILNDKELTEDQKIEQIKIAIDNGADVDAKDIYGYPLVIRACNLGYSKIVKLLVEKGADVNVMEPIEDLTLIFCAIYKRDLKLVRFLVEKGADVEATDIWLQTPLGFAADVGESDIVDYLRSLDLIEHHARTERDGMTKDEMEAFDDEVADKIAKRKAKIEKIYKRQKESAKKN
jgi:ankyrin repeat protein